MRVPCRARLFHGTLLLLCAKRNVFFSRPISRCRLNAPRSIRTGPPMAAVLVVVWPRTGFDRPSRGLDRVAGTRRRVSSARRARPICGRMVRVTRGLSRLVQMTYENVTMFFYFSRRPDQLGNAVSQTRGTFSIGVLGNCVHATSRSFRKMSSSRVSFKRTEQTKKKSDGAGSGLWCGGRCCNVTFNLYFSSQVLACPVERAVAFFTFPERIIELFLSTCLVSRRNGDGRLGGRTRFQNRVLRWKTCRAFPRRRFQVIPSSAKIAKYVRPIKHCKAMNTHRTRFRKRVTKYYAT